MNRHSSRTVLLLAAVAASAGVAFAIGWHFAPVRGDARTVEPAAAPEVWTCSMHPQVRQPGPGQCPICGMALVRAGAAAGGGEHAAHAGIDAGLLQQLGLREAEVVREAWQDTLRAPARLAFDERAQQVVQTRVGGFVTALGPRAPGDRVRRGDLLAEIYAPEAATAWAEYQALRRAGADDLAAAARARLERLGFALSALREGEEPRFVVRAPFDGVVEELMVSPGSAVGMGMPLLRLRDERRLWAVVEVPETEWPRLQGAAGFELVLDAWPDRRHAVVLDSTAPMVDMARRTLAVRLRIDDPDVAMRPGMLGEVRAQQPARRVLAIPSEAVLRSAGREWVLRRVGEGRFEPRAVRIGARREGRAEVLAGLRAGERVVASGQFLLDSEAYLARAFSDMGAEAGEALDADDAEKEDRGGKRSGDGDRDRVDRPGAADRAENADHSDHGNHGDHGDHGDHSDHSDHSDHGNHSDHSDHGDHGDQGDHNDHGSHSDHGEHAPGARP
jgi:Cu(I)/Ag(I) efflux system membrane fusion protein